MNDIRVFIRILDFLEEILRFDDFHCVSLSCSDKGIMLILFKFISLLVIILNNLLNNIKIDVFVSLAS